MFCAFHKNAANCPSLVVETLCGRTVRSFTTKNREHQMLHYCVAGVFIVGTGIAHVGSGGVAARVSYQVSGVASLSYVS